MSLDLYKVLKFVQGAVAKKDFVPAMKHFAIENGTVRSYNGIMALCSAIDFDIDCKPKAIPLVKAIQNCEDTMQLSMTGTGRLSIRSGAFKAFIECDQSEETPHVIPEGDLVEIDGEALLKAIKIVEPFIGDDASRQWTNGLLFSGQSLFATNNVCVIQYWIGKTFPQIVNVPRCAIEEIIRINEAFTAIQISDKSITFHYPNGRWIRTSLFSLDWPAPEMVETILAAQNPMLPINEQLFVGLKKIKPAVDKQARVYFTPGLISTTEVDGEGSSYSLDDHNFAGVYALDKLELLEGVATHIDFAAYPKGCAFRGPMLRGAILGRAQ